MNLVAVWFRNDLRIHDNGSIVEAVRLVKSRGATHVLPVFFYDPRYFGDDARSRQVGLLKTGMHRQRFIAESLRDLRKSLRAIGSDLLILEGRPEDVFKKLLPRGSTILTQKEVTQEELDIDVHVYKAGFKVVNIWGLTMYDLRDFMAGKFDETTSFTSCTAMIKKIDKLGIKPRECLPTPKRGDLPFPDHHVPGDEKDLLQRITLYRTAREQEPFLYAEDTGERSVYDDKYTYHVDPRGVMGTSKTGGGGIRGGETIGLKRLQYYLQPRLVDHYKATRNGMLGADYSSKLSAWLAHGCISPRLVYQRIKAYERAHGGANAGTNHLIFELRFRDFFIFYTRAHNPRIFFLDGVRPRQNAEWVRGARAEKLFQQWMDGETGIPLVDANMKELAATGYMSNRGRQNVASFLIFTFKVDWRWGAEYFEMALVDHHVCPNWGNWHSAAGLVGGRTNIFNIALQSRNYDSTGSYVRHWIPKLRNVPDSRVHEPYRVPRPTARAFAPQSKGELQTAVRTCFQDVSLNKDPYDAARWRPEVPLYDNKYARALHGNKYEVPLYDTYARALHGNKYAVHDAGTATLFHTTTSTTPAAMPTVVITDWVSPGPVEAGIISTCVVFVFIMLAVMAAFFSIHRKTTSVKKGSPPIVPDHTDPPETVKENAYK